MDLACNVLVVAFFAPFFVVLARGAKELER
jgi:hypothetical protein